MARNVPRSARAWVQSLTTHGALPRIVISSRTWLKMFALGVRGRVTSEQRNSSSNFWGSARDLGLVAVGIVSFSGLIYTYTYLRVLGIDFSAADISPTASLVAASKIFVYNAPLVLIAAIAVGILWAAARRYRGLQRLRQRVYHLDAQVALTVAAALRHLRFSIRDRPQSGARPAHRACQRCSNYVQARIRKKLSQRCQASKYAPPVARRSKHA